MDAATAQLEPPTSPLVVSPSAVPPALAVPPHESPLPAPAEATGTTGGNAKPYRDHRLDFWRGLCLIDMLLVHLVRQGMSLGTQGNLWVGEYTRFAAGGFVFIAGLSIGTIFLPRARDPEKRWPTYKALWRRSLVILAVHYIAEIGFLLMWPLYGGYGFRHLSAAVWDVLTLRAGYDLLPLYVVMVALAPAMLELMRRGLWWVVAIASVALFTAAHATGVWATWTIPIQKDFFPVLWQVMFVTGLLAAQVLPKYDRLARGWKFGLLAGVWAAHAVLFVGYYGPNFGLHLWLPFTFAKVPLTTGEALRYLTLIVGIMVSTDLLWRGLAGGAAAGFCERLGRNSLAVYVFHVWGVQATVHASALLPETTARVLLALAGLGAMWVFASLLEAGKPAKGRKAAPTAAGQPAMVGRAVTDAQGIRPTDSPVRPGRSFRTAAATLGRLQVGGLPALAVATMAAVYVGNTVQRHLSRKMIGGGQVITSPVSELLSPRAPESGPDYYADPPDDDVVVSDEEEEQPTGSAGTEGGSRAVTWREEQGGASE
jgi:hypothetical protein